MVVVLAGVVVDIADDVAFVAAVASSSYVVVAVDASLDAVVVEDNTVHH